MEKIPVTNPNAMPIYVSGLMIPPGETRHFDRAQVPPEFLPKIEEEEAPQDAGDPLTKLQEGSVKDISEALPGLSDEDLERLGEIEQQSAKPRSSLLGKIAELQLERVNARNA